MIASRAISRLRLPGDLPAGRYPLQVTLYDPNSVAPIPYTTADTPSSTNEQTTQPLTLAELQVGDTMKLLSPLEQ